MDRATQQAEEVAAAEWAAAEAMDRLRHIVGLASRELLTRWLDELDPGWSAEWDRHNARNNQKEGSDPWN